MKWKKGRGRLGIFEPLIGNWISESDSERGLVVVSRNFSKALAGKYIKLEVEWKFRDSSYEEYAMFGINRDNVVAFWSFTSDGKQSSGVLADASDLDENAIAFEAQMPAGIARQAYWPSKGEGFHWVVESKTKKGWNRFVNHEYKPV